MTVMTVLQRHQPVVSTAPRVVVHNELPPGRHRFEPVGLGELD
jgi:hypothetical protein